MGRMAEAYVQGGHVPNSTCSGHHRRAATQDSYPYAPAIGKVDTSHRAAEAVKPAFNKKQRLVLSHLERSDLTNSEIFAREAGLSPAEMARYCELRALERGLQPRAGELSLKGKVFDSGKRRKNPNGRDEVVWSTHDPSKPKSPKQGLLL